MMERYQQSGQRRSRQRYEPARTANPLVTGLVPLIGETVLSPFLLVPLLLGAAGASWGAIGLVVALAVAAPAVGRLVELGNLPPGWLLGARAIALLLSALAAAMFASAGGWLVAVLLLPLTFFWLGADVTRENGTDGTPSWRSAAGALVLIGTVLLAGTFISDAPSSVAGAMLIVGALGSLAIAVVAWWSWDARPAAAATDESPSWRHLPAGIVAVGFGRRNRRYLVFRLVLGLASLADPFIILACMLSLGLTGANVGLLLLVATLTHYLGGLALPHLARLGHARAMAQIAAFLRFAIPLAIVTLPMALTTTTVTSRFASQLTWLVPLAGGLAVVLLALAQALTEHADRAYWQDAVAKAQRPGLASLRLVVAGVLALAFLLGGGLADRGGSDLLFGTATAAGLLAILATGLLLDVPPATTRALSETGGLPTFREQEDWA